MTADFQRSPTLCVRGDHRWLGPIQVPSVLDGENGIGAGDDILQIKRTVEVALIAAEEIAVLLWIVRDQDNHGSAEGLARVLGRSFNVQPTAYHGQRDGRRGARGYRDVVTGNFGAFGGNLRDGVRLVSPHQHFVPAGRDLLE